MSVETLSIKEAATYAARSIATINRWRRRGWLKSISTRSLEFNVCEMDRAMNRAAEFFRDARLRAARRTAEKRWPAPPGTLGVTDSATYAGVSKTTIYRWYKNGFLQSACENSCRFLAEELDRVAKERKDHARRVWRQHAQAIQPDGIKSRCPELTIGCIGVNDAAARANVSTITIRNWHRARRLKAADTKPLQFYPLAVDNAAKKFAPVRPDDITIAEISHQFPGDRQKANGRVRSAIKSLKIQTYWRAGTVSGPGGPNHKDIPRVRPLKCIRNVLVPSIVDFIDTPEKRPIRHQGRPRKWDKLRDMIVTMPDAKPAEIAAAYNLTNPPQTATKITVQYVRHYDRGRNSIRSESITPQPTPASETNIKIIPLASVAPQTKPVKKTGKTLSERKSEKFDWLSKAMFLIEQHPEWPDNKIAEEVGRSPSLLSKNKQFQQAKQLSKSRSKRPTRGYKNAETGEIDAFDS